MMMLKWKIMVVKNEVDHNMSVKSKAHEISNKSIHTSYEAQWASTR